MTDKYCNKCGRKLDDWDMMADFSISRVMPYGSKYDGDFVDVHLCCDCMDELVDDCKISPVRMPESF